MRSVIISSGCYNSHRLFCWKWKYYAGISLLHSAKVTTWILLFDSFYKRAKIFINSVVKNSEIKEFNMNKPNKQELYVLIPLILHCISESGAVHKSLARCLMTEIDTFEYCCTRSIDFLSCWMNVEVYHTSFCWWSCMRFCVESDYLESHHISVTALHNLFASSLHYCNVRYNSTRQKQ